MAGKAGAAPPDPGATGSISVIVAVWNGERFVADAVRSALAQTRPPMEIVVVDDGSTDATASVIETLAAAHPSVRLVEQPTNTGPAAARNRAIAASTGSLLAPLDADDTWPADRLELMAAHLDAHPEVAIVLGQQDLVVEGDGPLPEWASLALGPGSGGVPVPTNSFLARRTVFEAIGAYAEDLRHGEDSDWFLRAREAGFAFTILDDLVLHRRLHDANLTLDADRQRHAMFDVLRRRVARRRSEGGSEERSGTGW